MGRPRLVVIFVRTFVRIVAIDRLVVLVQFGCRFRREELSS